MGSDRLDVSVARVYDEPGDGFRVLVDRLWPRGVSKERLVMDEWSKDVAPTPDLRKWYGHEPSRFDEFASRYREELGRSPALEVVRRLRATAAQGAVVLLTATRDVERSAAAVLRDHLLAGQRSENGG